MLKNYIGYDTVGLFMLLTFLLVSASLSPDESKVVAVSYPKSQA